MLRSLLVFLQRTRTRVMLYSKADWTRVWRHDDRDHVDKLARLPAKGMGVRVIQYGKADWTRVSKHDDREIMLTSLLVFL